MEPAYGIRCVILVMAENFVSQLRRRLMISHRTVDESDKEIADREDRYQEVGKEDAKMRKHNISMPDDAEGQRLNP